MFVNNGDENKKCLTNKSISMWKGLPNRQTTLYNGRWHTFGRLGDTDDVSDGEYCSEPGEVNGDLYLLEFASCTLIGLHYQFKLRPPTSSTSIIQHLHQQTDIGKYVLIG